MFSIKRSVFVLITFLFAPFVFARQVLLISSYSESFETVDLQKKGIHEIFDPLGITLDIEYMDMKKYNTADNEQFFFNMIKYKIAHHQRYDAVLLADDAALVFAQKHQTELFDGIPLVFFCVNDFERARTAGQNPMIAGAVEEMYLKDTIIMALRMQKDVVSIISIYDNTLTGKGDKDYCFALRDILNGCILSGINTSECTHEEFIRRLESISSDSVVLYQSAFEDEDGNQYTISQSAKCIAEHTHVPVYRASIGGVGEGLLGGKMVSYEDSGKKAAEIVVEILNGKPVNQIPVQMTGSSRYVFDYNVLKKFSIPLSFLPKKSVLLNKNPAFFELYKKEVPFFALIVAIVLLVIGTLVNTNVRRQKFMKLFRYQAEHDYLTGLLNRRAAMNDITVLISQGKKVAAILIDIDDFKLVNDSDGHAAGDMILIETSNRLRRLAEKEECRAARFGGDEFLLYSVKAETSYIQMLIEEISESFDQSVSAGSKSYYVKMSIGIAYSSGTSMQAGELVLNSDIAMYSVKKAGKNGYAYFDEKMKQEIVQKKRIEDILVDACANEDFSVVYQPQVDVQTGRTCCYESLLRLKSGKIGPGEFIPVAETTDIIIRIGRFVTRSVIEQMALYRDKGRTLLPVSINFSSMQIRDTGFVGFLDGLLRKFNMSPSLIEIELPEGIFLGRSEQSMKLFRDFSSIGVSLTLDDFGTGYSSINYLTYIPVNKIKLDKSLIDTYLLEGKEIG